MLNEIYKMQQSDFKFARTHACKKQGSHGHRESWKSREIQKCYLEAGDQPWIL